MFKEVYQRLPKRALFISLSILLLLITTEIVCTFYIPVWRKFFYNTLSAKDINAFYNSLWLYLILISLLTFAQSFKAWCGQRLSLIVRTGLTKYLLRKWTTAGKINEVDNPCQRINEDSRLCTELTVGVLTEVIISATIVVSLVISSIDDTKLLLLSLGYTIIVMGIAHFFKPGLINADLTLQKAEADHRFSLSRITLGQGDYTAPGKYEVVKTFYNKWVNTLLRYSIFNSMQTNFMPLIAYLVLCPLFFAGTLTLGDFMGKVAVFDLLVLNSTILVQLFPTITRAQASFKRITLFNEKLNGTN